MLRTLILVFAVISSIQSFAQDGIKYKNPKGYDFTVTTGTFLPFGIVGVRDSYPFWGLMFSHPTSLNRVEYGLLNGHAKGVIFWNAFVSLRIDFDAFQAVNGFFSIGPDVSYYKRKSTQSREFDYSLNGGFHFGFGAILDLSKNIAMRPDFKMNFSPGRSMYVGLGFLFRFLTETDNNESWQGDSSLDGIALMNAVPEGEVPLFGWR